MEKSNHKVMVCVLSLSAHVHVELIRRLLRWQREGALAAFVAGVSPVDHARNEAVRTFFKYDFTHLLFVDDDTIPPMDAIHKLLALDADVATGITKILRKGENGEFNTAWNCFINATDDGTTSTMETVDEDTGVVPIIRAGTSCMLIKRETLENVGYPWFKTVWRGDYTGYVSEDIQFCDRVIAAGMKILCDTSVKCAHYKGVMME